MPLYSPPGVTDQGVITYLDDTVAAAPGTPASGKLRMYAKTGKVLAVKDDAGTETVLTAGGAQQFTEDTPRYRLLGTFSRLSQKVSGSTDAYILLQSGTVDMVSDAGSGPQAEFNLANGAVLAFAYDGTNFVQLNMLAGAAHGFTFSLDAGTFIFLGGPIKLPLLSADPGSPVEGWLYGNTSTNKARYYDGTAWHDLF